MPEQSPRGGAAGPRGARVMRPYEWTHMDGDFREWLQRQGFSEDNWDPPAWAKSVPGVNEPGLR